jgi:tRNA nucleotidyltransferase (CCA-adding enzyme)
VAQFNTGSTLRVAGGWVRDRILGKKSDDIDIAIDNMMGEEFAKLVY